MSSKKSNPKAPEENVEKNAVTQYYAGRSLYSFKKTGKVFLYRYKIDKPVKVDSALTDVVKESLYKLENKDEYEFAVNIKFKGSSWVFSNFVDFEHLDMVDLYDNDLVQDSFQWYDHKVSV